MADAAADIDYSAVSVWLPPQGAWLRAGASPTTPIPAVLGYRSGSMRLGKVCAV
jgi:hypothetical protein